MNKLSALLMSMLLLVIVLCIAASAGMAQDMAKVAPQHVKVVLDNERARVLDVQLKAGEKLPMHSHPANIVYPMNGGKVKTTFPDGKVQEIEFKAGEARWSETVTHANEAVTDMHVLVIEINEHKMKKK